MNAISSAETLVSYTNAEEECNQAAASHEYTGPHMFYFEGGNVKAKDALHAGGDYRFKGSDTVEFHCTRIGEVNFTSGEVTETMICTSKTSGEPHSY